MKQKTNRTAAYPIAPEILHRWSPRSFTDTLITDEQLFTLHPAVPAEALCEGWERSRSMSGDEVLVEGSDRNPITSFVYQGVFHE